MTNSILRAIISHQYSFEKGILFRR